MSKICFLELQFVKYAGNPLPAYFVHDSLDEDLVVFYNEDAQQFQDEAVTRVMDVFHNGRLVAYYAYASSEIRAIDLEKTDRVADFAHPAIKLGRLLVCKSMRGKGIGTAILQKIAEVALDMKEKIPLRFLLVDALPQAVDFYKKTGFIDTGIKRGYSRDLSLLYIDLNKIVLD